MPTGTATVDFGAYPGASQASVVITGQGSITTSSFVEAWIRPQADTADHTVDEHIVEQLKVTASEIVNGTGFTIHVECINGLSHGQWDVNWVWA